MSIVKLTPDLFEQFSLVLHPKREYRSSSLGSTGSVSVYARRSDFEKEVQPLSAFQESKFNDQDLVALLDDISVLTSSDISLPIEKYLDTVNSQSQSARLRKSLNISRTVPDVAFSQSTVKKNIITNLLIPYHRISSPSSHFSYTNYHTLNFFTASDVPSNTALCYPNVESSNALDSRQYSLTGGFTFDFYINPRYTTDSTDQSYRAGCILNLSSSYSVFLVSGSSRDLNGKPDKFRLMIGLSQSAGISPSLVSTSALNNSRTGEQNLVFMSDDNSLSANTWHHVAVRWGTSSQNLGSGSFIIDREENGKFVIPSSSIDPGAISVTPSILLV